MSYHTTTMSLDVLNFMKSGDVDLNFNNAKKGYCKTIMNKNLICICNTPWIEGSTSIAMYGEMQQEFNAHCCLKCTKWYHTHCLKYYNLSRPSKKQTLFACSVKFQISFNSTMINTVTPLQWIIS